MAHRAPPIPPDQRSSQSDKPHIREMGERGHVPGNLREQGQAGNLHQNTRNQGYQQDR